MGTTSKLYLIAFLFVLAFYCLFFAHFGFENWDTGFVTSQSWRVSQGEQAFRDFLSIRPPVTPYFHGFIMQMLPQYGQVYTTRVLGYLLFALQVFFTVDGLDNLYKLERYRISKWGAVLFGFVLATGAIYPDPWFTVDGIFFASAAFFVLARNRNPKTPVLAVAAFLCVLSAATKQSFYFVPIFFCVWIFLCSGWKKALWFAGFSAVFTSVLVAIFSSIASFAEVLRQISNAGDSNALLQFGLLAYLNVFHTKFVWIGLFVLAFGFAFIHSGNRWPSAISVLKWFSIVIFLAALAAIPVFGFSASAAILLIAVKIAFWRKTKFSKIRIARYFPLAVLIGIAWCAGLSSGFPFPVLFVHALAFSYFILMFDDFGKYHVKRFYLLLCAPVGLYLFLGNFSRYRESEFSELGYSLEDVSAKLAGVITSEHNFEKWSELKKLREKYGHKYVVAPSSPQAYYVFGDRNPLPADWLTTFELNDAYGPYLQLTADEAKFVFVEKSFISGETFLNPDDDKDDFSQYANYLLKRQKPVQKAGYFWVYDASELASTLRKYPINTAR